MHDTEYRCAVALAAALGRDIQALIEADTVIPRDGEARWHDGDGNVQIAATVSGKVHITFDGWSSRTEFSAEARRHFWLLNAAVAAIEEAREPVAVEVEDDPC